MLPARLAFPAAARRARLFGEWAVCELKTILSSELKSSSSLLALRLLFELPGLVRAGTLNVVAGFFNVSRSLLGLKVAALLFKTGSSVAFSSSLLDAGSAKMSSFFLAVFFFTAAVFPAPLLAV
jgi:hypothetical protein